LVGQGKTAVAESLTKEEPALNRREPEKKGQPKSSVTIDPPTKQ
jgi:hypothetical protein